MEEAEAAADRMEEGMEDGGGGGSVVPRARDSGLSGAANCSGCESRCAPALWDRKRSLGSFKKGGTRGVVGSRSRGGSGGMGASEIL